MKATELRIGNLVNRNFYDYYRPSRVTGYDLWHSEELADVKHWAEWNAISPIPLTEEWLLKFGFEKKPPNMPLYYKDRIFVNMGNHGIVHIMASENTYTIPVQFDGFKVHQLQNLYFALTGEELEVLNQL